MRYRLQVPYHENAIVKALGARFDWEGRYWYCEELTEELKLWYEGEEEGEEIPSSSPPLEIRQPEGNDPWAAYRSVTDVADMIRRSFQATPAFLRILVKGEVSNFSGAARPHYYFSIKDEKSLLSCRLWGETARSALKFRLENGQQVALAGRLEFYEARGEASLIVSEIHDMGAGAEALALLELKEKLQAEGIFDPAHKKPIPAFPQKVGILTSKDGQAIRDTRAVSHRRNPFLQLLLYHVNVQGKNAAASLRAGLEYLDDYGADVIIMGRGGGSAEDLSAFNDEALVRAVYAAKTPLISAVGHEGHWTLVDYVADERAATPSEAAEKAVPDVMREIKRLESLQVSLKEKIDHQLTLRKMRLEAGRQRLLANDPARRLKERQERLRQLEEALGRQVKEAFESRKRRWELLTVALAGLSPAAKLVGGFGYITKDEKPLRTVAEVKEKDRIRVRIHDGILDADVVAVRKEEAEA